MLAAHIASTSVTWFQVWTAATSGTARASRRAAGRILMLSMWLARVGKSRHLLTFPFYSPTMRHGHHAAAEGGSRFHRWLHRRAPLQPELRRDRARARAGLAGHGAQTHRGPGGEALSQTRLQPEPLARPDAEVLPGSAPAA